MWHYSITCYVLAALLALTMVKKPMADNSGLGVGGGKSSGRLGISLIKPDIAHISGLDDVLIPHQLSGADVTWERAACVYSTNKSGYRVMLDSEGVVSKRKSAHKYDIEWNPSGINGRGDALALKPGVPLSIKHTAEKRTLCSRNQHMTEASLTIKIPKDHMKKTDDADRSGSITVLISPN
jgi:hypothetical protein